MPKSEAPTKPLTTKTQGSKDYIAELETEVGDYDYLIVSDGSGFYEDSIGGCCSIVIGPQQKVTPIFLSRTHTTTTRMEFHGLLEGLEFIRGQKDFYPGINVSWICDNKSMVDGVNDETAGTANPDLWLLFDYYLSQMKITAKHISRENTYLLHNLCDLHSTILRDIMIEHVKCNWGNNLNGDANEQE